MTLSLSDKQLESKRCTWRFRSKNLCLRYSRFPKHGKGFQILYVFAGCPDDEKCLCHCTIFSLVTECPRGSVMGVMNKVTLFQWCYFVRWSNKDINSSSGSGGLISINNLWRKKHLVPSISNHQIDISDEFSTVGIQTGLQKDSQMVSDNFLRFSLIPQQRAPLSLDINF